MKKINWAEELVRPKFGELKGIEDPFFATKRVNEMTLMEAIRVASLRGWGKALAITSVYADEKFNSEDNNKRMWSGQQENIISIIYASKSIYNFRKACSAFCGISPDVVDINSGVIEKVVKTVADAEQEFQADYCYRAACNFGSFKDFPHIVSYLSHTENAHEASKAYGKFYNLMSLGLDEEATAKEVRNIMTTSSKNMQMQINDGEDTVDKPITDKTAIIEFFDDMPCYSRGTSRPRIKIKSINTLPHTTGVRPR